MSIILKLIILSIGLSLSGWVIMLLVRNKINERNTLVWLFGVFFVFLLTINPEWLDQIASLAGVDYPPSLLFLCSFIILLVVSLYQSIQISQLYAKLKEVSQYVALLQEKIEDENNSKR